MATGTVDPALTEPMTSPVRPELLVSALLHLMSHYTLHSQEAGSCTRLASVIERHLQALADLPDLAPVLRATCRQLTDQWAGIVERAMPQSGRRNSFARFTAGVRPD